MIISPKEQRLIKAIREADCDIAFLLIHLSNLYERQAKLDKKSKRANQKEMIRRADLFYKAYNEVMNQRVLHNSLTLYLVKKE